MTSEQDLNSHWQTQLQSPVAVLLGGRSAEREISLQSGEAVLAALRAGNITAEAVDTRQENWLETVVARYRHCFIALHGGDGEDGTVQAALERSGLTYTGSGVEASALAMDKMRCKQLWQQMDLPTPAYEPLYADSDWAGIIDRYGKVIVKPASEGSSIGMAIATSAEDLQTAFEAASQYEGAVMVEQWIQGAEFTVAILGEQALPAIRLETDHGFYDYDAKYIADDTRYICPCGLDPQQEQRLKKLSLAAFESIGGRGWGRVDFMQDEQGEFYLLEVNTVPGMTSHSLVPMAANAAGIDFEQLVTNILRLSVV